jgi:hypothetical protein
MTSKHTKAGRKARRRAHHTGKPRRRPGWLSFLVSLQSFSRRLTATEAP